MTGKFAGRVVVVTGAAQSLGLECARAFCSEGASVVLVDNNCEKVTAAAELLQRSGFRATATPLDVRSQEQTITVVDQIFNQLGRLDVWVNNAGVAHHCDTFNLLPEPWQNSMDVMLSGPFYCCQEAGKIMRMQGGGSIINMASVNGFVPQPRRAAYCTAKAGLIMLTRVLASEWAQHHIRVNAVAPSPVEASGMAQILDNAGLTSLAHYKTRHPMQRMAQLREVTDAVLFLASDDASFVTGETLCIDGGWVAFGSM